MKKLFKITLIIMICIFVTNVKAKTISDVACFYQLKNTSGEYMTTAQIQIIGYNDGTGGRVVIFYKNEKGNYVNYAQTGPTTVYENSEKVESFRGYTLAFFTSDKNGKTFISRYKESGQCPSVVTNLQSASSSMISIENGQTNPDNEVKTINASSEQLRDATGENKWILKSEFYKNDSGQTTVKEDLVCNYDMEFDMYNIKTPVEFRTIYNPSNGNKTYKVSVNGVGYTYSNLDTDIGLNLGQGGSQIVYITSAQLKKIFIDGSCYDRTKVYHYYDMSGSRYIITTDQKEASENGVAGRYDNGDGSNDGAGGTISAPELNINQNPMTCEEILGTGLTAIIKTFIVVIRIVAVIIAVVIAMANFIPPIMNGNPDGELKKAFNKTVKLFVVLVIVVSFPNIISLIGKLFNFDLSCIF